MSDRSGDDAWRTTVGLPRTLREWATDMLARMTVMGEPPERVLVTHDPQTGRVDVFGPMTSVEAELHQANMITNHPPDLADVSVWVGYWNGPL